MNLIITCPRRMEHDAREEAATLLQEMGDSQCVLELTEISGIIYGTTELNPHTLSRELTDMVLQEPWRIRYIRRVIPIERTALTSIAHIKDLILPLIPGISKEQTYRITVEKRNSGISSADIINTVAGIIPNRVCLENPDVIVQIEIMGGITGVSLIRPGDIFSLDIVKRSISED